MLDRFHRPARMLIVWAAIAAVLCGATAAAAQTPSLAELARKEQERRKGQKTPAKVYTKKDLPPKPPGEAAAPAGQQPARPTSSAAESDDRKAADERAKAEATWRARIADAREELRRSEAFAEALQTRINGLGTDFVNRDDPYQRAKIGQDRDKAIAELGRVKGDVERARQKIADIEEEARKAGVPPGWLR